jgi:hypothetical protein
MVEKARSRIAGSVDRVTGLARKSAARARAPTRGPAAPIATGFLFLQRYLFLAILGTNEPEIGAPADLEVLKWNARSSSRAETALIEGADHVYTTTAEDVARAIEGFLARLA